MENMKAEGQLIMSKRKADEGGLRLPLLSLSSTFVVLSTLLTFLCGLQIMRIDFRYHIPSAAPVNAPVKPVEQIFLIGERHSGTNWITDYLTECFQTDQVKVSDRYMRYKHWFQEEGRREVPDDSSLVVVMFRDPYAWVEAMRVKPHHAHSHVNMPETIDENKKHLGWTKKGGRPLDWHEFVTKPWIGKNNTDSIGGLAKNFYELQHDGSGRAYSSIVDLRRDKIINFLSVADFSATRALLPMRFEDLNVNGTASLLKSIEEKAGLKANCDAIVGKAGRDRRLKEKKITTHAELPQEFIEWMNRYVDWEVEHRIGYYKRELDLQTSNT